MKDFSDVLCYFPGKVGKLISDTINNSNNASKIVLELQEIRIRCNRPIILRLRSCEIVIEYNVLENEILSILEKLCNFHAQKKVMAVLIKNIRISTHVTLRPRTPE